MTSLPRTLARWALAATALTLVLIVVGGIVRITGSGMGCGDHWPRCNGEWFPPLDFPTFVEISHRWVAALASVAIAGTALIAWRRHRAERRLLTPALLGAGLLVVQVLLGAVTVKLELPPAVVIVHLLNAMLVLGAVIWTALEAGLAPHETLRPETSNPVSRSTAAGLAVFGLVVILWGAQVANLNAGAVCRGFPLCAGAGIGPPDTALGPLHWAHRVLAYGFLVASAAVAWRLRGATSALRRAGYDVLAATLAQIAVAAAMVLLALPAPLRALHLLTGTGVWATLVVLTHRVWRAPAAARSPAGVMEAAASATSPSR